MIRRLLDRLDDRGYDMLIRSLTPRLRRFLGERNRDEMSGILWRVLLTTPHLWRILPHLVRGYRPRVLPTSQAGKAYEAEI